MSLPSLRYELAVDFDSRPRDEGELEVDVDGLQDKGVTDENAISDDLDHGL